MLYNFCIVVGFVNNFLHRYTYKGYKLARIQNICVLHNKTPTRQNVKEFKRENPQFDLLQCINRKLEYKKSRDDKSQAHENEG